jgi:hypothetical protein
MTVKLLNKLPQKLDQSKISLNALNFSSEILLETTHKEHFSEVDTVYSSFYKSYGHGIKCFYKLSSNMIINEIK